MKPARQAARGRGRSGLRIAGWALICLAGILIVTAVLAALIPTELDYTIETPESSTSATGLSTLNIPYDSTGLSDASDLLASIESHGPAVVSISRYLRSTGALQTYTGPPFGGDDFDLHGGEGYLVQTTGDNPTYPYDIEGDHDTATEIYLYEHADTILWPVSEGTSAAGITDYGPPYCGVSATASALRDEIDAAAGSSVVVGISRFNRSSDAYEEFDGENGDFDLMMGESYRVEVSTTVNFVPDLVQLGSVIGSLDSILSVKAFPAVPGCEADNGTLEVTNSSPRLHFRAEIAVAYEVREAGDVMDCTNCTDAVDGCSGCGLCDWCRTAVIELAPSGVQLIRGMMPHCTPSCDNRFCGPGSVEQHEYCRDDDACTNGDCVSLGGCPTGAAYHCNAVRDACLGGSNDGGRCNDQEGNVDCPGGGQCKDAGSVEVTVTAFKCVGDPAWVEKICDGGANDEEPCDDGSDCPSGSCEDVAITWNGTIAVQSTTFDQGFTCPL